MNGLGPIMLGSGSWDLAPPASRFRVLLRPRLGLGTKGRRRSTRTITALGFSSFRSVVRRAPDHHFWVLSARGLCLRGDRRVAQRLVTVAFTTIMPQIPPVDAKVSFSVLMSSTACPSRRCSRAGRSTRMRFRTVRETPAGAYSPGSEARSLCPARSVSNCHVRDVERRRFHGRGASRYEPLLPYN